MAASNGKWSAFGLWLLVIFSVSYTLPSIVGSDKLPDWFNEMFSSKLAYGLDLQGGIDMTLQVEVDEAVISTVHRSVAPLKTLADDDGLNLADVRRARGEPHEARAVRALPRARVARAARDAVSALSLARSRESG